VTPDFRYHVASLSAIFLALGIGILVGTAFVGTKVVDRQTTAVNRLTKETIELRKETHEREQTEKTLQDALPLLVKETLIGKTVLVVQVGSGREAAEQAQKALELAGATVERETVADDDTGESLGLASRSDLPRLVVLAGGESEEQAQRRDIPLLKALHSVGVRTVAVELYETPVSLVPLWSTAADATVDCANRATGWLALIVALQGESGNLGLKTGAITPPLEPLVKPTPTPLPSPTPEP
jgi:hypothetical protein